MEDFCIFQLGSCIVIKRIFPRSIDDLFRENKILTIYEKNRSNVTIKSMIFKFSTNIVDLKLLYLNF